MSNKGFLLAVLCVVGTLVALALLPAFAVGPKKHGTRMHTENSAPASVSFTLKNNSTTNGLPVSKP